MLFSIHNQFLTVDAEKRGAQLQSILGADGVQYLWQGDTAYWPDRALNLFPYVARLTDGEYYLDGQLYHMDIHGLAPYSDFTCKECTDTRMVLELVSDAQSLTAYPRQFAFRVIYALEGSTLFITYEVENRDRRLMYFGLGGHPGFNVPLDGGAFEDYRLRFDPCEPVRVGFTEVCFLSGQDTPYPLRDGFILDLRHNLFDQDAIVLKNIGHRVTLEGPGTHTITVDFPDMDYLGIWHMPKTDAPYVCLEPWFSLPSTQGKIAVFEEQSDLARLEAGGMYRNTWSINIDRI